MLKQPMIEKFAAMRLLGMVEALKAPEQDPTARELSFLERFGLLVDQQLELAGEPGTLTTPEECQAAHAERLCGGDRLSHRPRPRQERDPFSHAAIRLARDAR